MSEELVYGLRSLMDAVDDNPGRNIEVASSLCKDLGEMVYKQQARIEALELENDANKFRAEIAGKRNIELESGKLVLMERDEKYCNTISGLQAENIELQTENERLKARIEALEKALTDAIDDIECWGAYADDYFQKKHDFEGCIAGHRALLEASDE